MYFCLTNDDQNWTFTHSSISFILYNSSITPHTMCCSDTLMWDNLKVTVSRKRPSGWGMGVNPDSYHNNNQPWWTGLTWQNLPNSPHKRSTHYYQLQLTPWIGQMKTKTMSIEEIIPNIDDSDVIHSKVDNEF